MTSYPSRNVWVQHYINPVVGYIAQGVCAACEYSGPPDDFVVWNRGFKWKTLCSQCSRDVRETMQHEGWLKDVG